MPPASLPPPPGPPGPDCRRLILGIDPGTATFGYGLVGQEEDHTFLVEYGAFTTPAAQPLPGRLKHIHQGLLDLIQRAHPTEMAVEELFVGRNAQAARGVYQAKGVALLAAAHTGLPVSEYTPLQVKRAITRYGRASKAQMQEMVRLLLNLEAVPEPDDAADAVAVAICHLYARRQG